MRLRSQAFKQTREHQLRQREKSCSSKHSQPPLHPKRLLPFDGSDTRTFFIHHL
jgi:hypothetical protein